MVAKVKPAADRLHRRLPEENGQANVVKLVIPKVVVKVLEVEIRGTSTLIIRAWDQKTAQMLADKQEGKRAVKSRENKSKEEIFNGARYIAEDGWDGIPAGAFRAAMINAVSCANIPRNEFNMTQAKMAIFIIPDGIDKVSKRDLVRIYGKPEIYSVMQPTSGGGPYMSHRPMYRNWSCKLRIKFNAGKIDEQGCLNLLTLAGAFVGVGEHRPSSPESKTGSNGLFEIIPNR